MGQASASSSSSTGINAAGGSNIVNKPNTWLWVVVGVAVVMAAVVLIKWRKK